MHNNLELNDLIEKIIDCQNESTKVIASLRSSLLESQNALREAKQDIESIKKSFYNGFRSELKSHITNSVDDSFEKVKITDDQLIAKLDLIIMHLNNFKSLKFWIKLAIGGIAAIGIISAAIIKIIDLVRPSFLG